MVTLKSQFRAKSYYMVTKLYDSNKYQKAEMQIGYDYSIGFPYRVYLTFIATGVNIDEPGDFGMDIKYVKFDPL
jgi:hypothetical protein